MIVAQFGGLLAIKGNQMARRNSSAAVAIGIAGAAFVAIGVGAVLVFGVPGDDGAAPYGKEQAAVMAAIRDQYWSARVDVAKWWSPSRSGQRSTVRVRYTVSRDGMSAPLDEVWSYDYRSGRAAYLYQSPDTNIDGEPTKEFMDDIANGKFTK